jgi:predicted aspartyl protease/Flp pilus assembly protein TadD
MNRFPACCFPLLALPVLAFATVPAHGEACSVAGPHPLTPAQIALMRGSRAEAETLYRQDLAAHPKDEELTAGLVRTLLAEEKVDEAAATIKAALASDPQSPVLLTSLANTQFRQGLPWEEEKTLALAQARGLCYARLHLTLSRYYRFNSYYATALKELKLAYQLDPYDPAIRNAWVQTLPLKDRIEELKKVLAGDTADAEAKKGLEHELAMLEDRLENRSQPCRLVSPATTTDIDFTGIMIDAQRLRGWGLDVAFNGHKARLQVDTGAGGLYVSRSVAEHAGLKAAAKSEASGIGDKGGQTGYTAYADSIKIGGLEFKNCVVEVSDRRSIVGTDGLIGMDVFSRFLVTLDFPWHKLTLSPLPPYPGTTEAPAALNTEETSAAEAGNSGAKDAGAGGAKAAGGAEPAPVASGPHDRYVAPEMKDWTKVYRVGHDLIVPTALNGKSTRLFVVDTGAQSTSISPAAAREVTKVETENNVRVTGISGNVEKVYRSDELTVRFAHLQQKTDGMLTFDTSGISKDVGAEISGFLGFDVLHLLVVRIDYRDGLVNFEYAENRGYQHIR